LWFGKLAIIAYVFSGILLCIGFLLATAFDDWDVFGEAQTQDNIDTLIGRQTSVGNATEANPTFIFGDYFAATQAIGTMIFNVPTGGVIADVIPSVSIFANLHEPIYYLIRFLITFSSACLVINMLSGREL
jgi:hypothetical protein